MSFFRTEEEDANTPCGHCDNCTRAPDTLERLGERTRLAAWRLLRVATDARKELTMTQLCDLARGLGSSAAAGTGKGKGKGRAKEKVTVDLERVAGGKVELSKEVRAPFPPRPYCLVVWLPMARRGCSSAAMLMHDLTFLPFSPSYLMCFVFILHDRPLPFTLRATP